MSNDLNIDRDYESLEGEEKHQSKIDRELSPVEISERNKRQIRIRNLPVKFLLIAVGVATVNTLIMKYAPQLPHLLPGFKKNLAIAFFDVLVFATPFIGVAALATEEAIHGVKGQVLEKLEKHGLYQVSENDKPVKDSIITKMTNYLEDPETCPITKIGRFIHAEAYREADKLKKLTESSDEVKRNISSIRNKHLNNEACNSSPKPSIN